MSSFRALTWVELKLFLREPLTVLFVLVLPLALLYVLNGVFGSSPPDPAVWEGLDAVDFYTASYAALAAATAGVLSLPVHLAGYREHGVLRRFQATAISPAVLVLAHMTVTAIGATAGAVLLVAVSFAGYNVSPPSSWAGVLIAYLVVTAAFVSLGALLGFLLPTARAAQGLGVLLFFVFMMLGGAGPPREVLPSGLGGISDVVPVTYAARMIRGPWTGRGWDGTGTLVIVGMLLASLLATVWLVGRRGSRG